MCEIPFLYAKILYTIQNKLRPFNVNNFCPHVYKNSYKLLSPKLFFKPMKIPVIFDASTKTSTRRILRK